MASAENPPKVQPESGGPGFGLTSIFVGAALRGDLLSLAGSGSSFGFGLTRILCRGIWPTCDRESPGGVSFAVQIGGALKHHVGRVATGLASFRRASQVPLAALNAHRAVGSDDHVALEEPGLAEGLARRPRFENLLLGNVAPVTRAHHARVTAACDASQP